MVKNNEQDRRIKMLIPKLHLTKIEVNKAREEIKHLRLNRHPAIQVITKLHSIQENRSTNKSKE